MELTRKQVIDNLEKFVKLRLMTSGFCETELFESFIYAISSLKTDEAYQLMYEGGEIFTKADVIAMLKEVRKQIKDMRTDFYEQGRKDISFGINIGMEEIQKKINSLKENT